MLKYADTAKMGVSLSSVCFGYRHVLMFCCPQNCSWTIKARAS